MLLKKMLENRPSSILDIVCGQDVFLENCLSNDLRHRWLLKNVIALDLREEYLKELKKRYKVGQTTRGDACNLPLPDKSIDLVCCNALLEHLPTGKRKESARDVFCKLKFPNGAWGKIFAKVRNFNLQKIT